MPATIQDINFIPDEIIESQVEATRISSANKMSLGLAIFLLMAGAAFWGYNFYQKQELAKAKQQAATYETNIQNLKDFGEEGYKLGTRLQSIKSILDSRQYYSKLIEQVDELTPEGVDVVTWQASSDGVMQLEGISSPNYLPIADFEGNLQSDPKEVFADVKLTTAALEEEDGDIKFGMSITLSKESLNARE